MDSERHRLIASAYAGLGKDLDRFSAFRFAGRPDASEWEAISRPDLPGAAFDEFFSRSYGNALERFVETGEASAEFLKYLETSPEAGHAVEAAFQLRAHRMNDFRDTLEVLGTEDGVIERQRAVAILPR